MSLPKPYYSADGITIYHGDAMDILPHLSYLCEMDSCVTDPPYGLKFMGRKWDYDVPTQELWGLVLAALKPGAHLLAFAGTRTQHRMACRIEDAGFEIRDMIGWLYGSGFPKSLDVSKAIDRAAGAERETIANGSPKCSFHARGLECTGHGDGRSQSSETIHAAPTAPATDAAREWQGWGSALKPAMEPITMARKPFKGTIAANVLEHGTGGLNIDACRIEADGPSPSIERRESYAKRPDAGEAPPRPTGATFKGGADTQVSADYYTADRPGESLGRFPANIIHDGSPEVLKVFPSEAGGATVGGWQPCNDTGSRSVFSLKGERNEYKLYADSGSAARFFYCAKSSKGDRDAGLEDFARVSAGEATGGRADGSAGLDCPRAGAGRTNGSRNHHPTVKPVDLMRYLCRLVTRRGGLILDPFMGSGSTGKAAMMEGFRFIGIEREEKYCEIAARRMVGQRELGLDFGDAPSG